MAKLAHNSYGKSDVRVTKVTRHGSVHHLTEMNVAIELQGGFERCYTLGDNSMVVPTDTMKNTVYALARKHDFGSPEQFGMILARHFIDSFAHVTQSKVTIEQSLWRRIELDGHPHDHAFVGGASERRGCDVACLSDAAPLVFGQISGLQVLKTTRSGFAGFIKDQYTTLKDVTDRIFATVVRARWHYTAPSADWNRCYDAIRQVLLRVFATHDSLAVQQTLYAMGEVALGACPEIDEIHLEMPNQHRLLVDLQPLGMDNPNVVFVPTSEPYGLITGTIRRE